MGEQLTTLLTICGGILTAAAFLALVTKVWRRTLGRFTHARSKVSRLSAGCTVEYFTGILGPPAIRRTSADLTEPGSPVGTVEHLELLWIDPLFHVQGVVRDLTVVRWAVTARHRRLRLRFALPPDSSRSLRFVLGRTPFAAVDPPGEPVDTFIGARRWGYAERLYFGNPGRYQHFWLALNDSTPLGGLVPDEELVAACRAATEDCADKWWCGGEVPGPVARFRQKCVPNTYSESIPGHCDPFPIGPDRDQIRLVVD